jgi:hypothetical protein
MQTHVESRNMFALCSDIDYRCHRVGGLFLCEVFLYLWLFGTIQGVYTCILLCVAWIVSGQLNSLLIKKQVCRLFFPPAYLFYYMCVICIICSECI